MLWDCKFKSMCRWMCRCIFCSDTFNKSFSSLLCISCAINRPWSDCNGCNLMRKKPSTESCGVYHPDLPILTIIRMLLPFHSQCSCFLPDVINTTCLLSTCQHYSWMLPRALNCGRGWNYTARPHYNNSQYNTVYHRVEAWQIHAEFRL